LQHLVSASLDRSDLVGLAAQSARGERHPHLASQCVTHSMVRRFMLDRVGCTTSMERQDASRLWPVEARSRARTPHHVERVTDASPVLDSLAPGSTRPACAPVGRQHACGAHRHERHVTQPCTYVRAPSALSLPAEAQHHARTSLHSLRRQPSRQVEPLEGSQRVAATAWSSLTPAEAFRPLHFECICVSRHCAAASLLQRWA
jgi:hypothetical protein